MCQNIPQNGAPFWGTAAITSDPAFQIPDFGWFWDIQGRNELVSGQFGVEYGSRAKLVGSQSAYV